MFSNISITNPTNRNTEARRVEIGDVSLFFSYETLVAVSAPGPHMRGRRDNVWGPTTGRHMSEMGVRDFPIMGEERLRGLATEALAGRWPS